LINNRQGSGGRRRGRGGQRPQGMGGQPGNRQDNRQRGNAAQLLEKYKSMARDSQLAGDRVQTEYYLQFADHYFRVLSESRARFEDQRPRSRDDDDADDGDDDMLETADEGSGEQQQQRSREYEDRPRRNERRERNDRGERAERPRRNARDDRDEGQDEERPVRRGRNGAEQPDSNEERISFDVLPPAIGGGDDGDTPDADEAPRPKRRIVRKPKTSDDDIAPAA
jgi:hypothetical protein